VPPVLDRIVRRCLEPDPGRRYQTAEELARALEGCLHLRRTERELPPAGPLTRASLKHPILLGVAFAFVPHIVATGVNIYYNALRIVSELSGAQEAAFRQAILCYNPIVYSICLWILVGRYLVPVLRVLTRMNHMQEVTAEQVADARRRALCLPMTALLCAAFGWLPGGVFFPAFIDVRSGPIAADVYLRFFVSFTISGLIAITYSVLGLQFFVLRVLYPQLWMDGQGMRELAPLELRGLDRRLRIFQFLAGVIPLVGALMMIGVGPEEARYESFRLLVTGMILLGSFGFSFALLAGAWLGKTLEVLRWTPKA
jgi:hypothetical protein